MKTISAGKFKFAMLKAIENAIDSLDGEISIYEKHGWDKAVEQTKAKIRDLEKEWQQIWGDSDCEIDGYHNEQYEFPEYCE